MKPRLILSGIILAIAYYKLAWAIGLRMLGGGTPFEGRDFDEPGFV